MNAFMVDVVHIDALITAGLQLPGPSKTLRWFWPLITEADREAFPRGVPISVEAVRLAEQRRRVLTPETAGRIGAMLLAENRRSVDHRYDEHEWEQPYEFHHLRGQADPLITLKAIDCYAYQSCEHPGWLTSEAFAFCGTLRATAIRRLPGYDAAPWDITDRNVFAEADRSRES